MKLLDFAIRQFIKEKDWARATVLFAQSIGDQDLLEALDSASYSIMPTGVSSVNSEIQIRYRSTITFWQDGLTGFAPYPVFYQKPIVLIYIAQYSKAI